MRWPLQPLQPFQQTQLQRPFGQSVDSLCHLWFTTTNVSYRFPILKLPPPPCAVLLVSIYIHVYSRQCWWNPNIHIVCRKARNHPFLLSTLPDFRINMRWDAVWQHLPQLLRPWEKSHPSMQNSFFSMGKSCAKWLRTYLYIRYKICMYMYVYNTVYIWHMKRT